MIHLFGVAATPRDLQCTVLTKIHHLLTCSRNETSFGKIAPLATRDLTTDRLTQDLPKYHISHLKCPKRKVCSHFMTAIVFALI
jgi:hypothetical protein